MQCIVLVCSAINLIDASALEILEGLIQDLQELNVKFYFSEVKGPVMNKLKVIGFINSVGHDHFFVPTDHAMRTPASI